MKSRKNSYLSLHDYLYINNTCWITLVKRQVGSDFSGLQGQALARSNRYKDTKV